VNKTRERKDYSLGSDSITRSFGSGAASMELLELIAAAMQP
jgi:hypothetical protein